MRNKKILLSTEMITIQFAGVKRNFGLHAMYSCTQ